MKVNNQININNTTQKEQPIELKKGEVYPAQIKERLSSNEAIVQIKGKDIRVVFEDKVPAGQRVLVQVVDAQEDIVVRSAPKQQGPVANEPLLDTALSPELRQAVQIINSQGTYLDKDIISNIKVFMEKSKGTVEQKIDTIKIMSAKGLEFTQNQLKAVHEALHGENFANIVEKISSQISKLSGDKIAMPSTGTVGPEKHIAEISDSIKEILMNLRNDGKTKEALKLLQQLILKVDTFDDISNQELSIDSSKLDQIISTVDSLQKLGMKTTALNRLTTELDRIISGSIEPVREETQVKALDNGDAEVLQGAQMALNLNGKDILITEVTKRMAKATDDFKNSKREAVKNIDNILKMTKGTNQNVSDYVKQNLEKTIDTIDRAILKSDITLFTDMSTEKKLMKVSSDLATAREYITRGDNEKASEILEKVKSTLDAMNWKPSKTKVIHFISKANSLDTDIPTHQKLSYNIGQLKSPGQNIEASARKAFDNIRQMGITNESDTAQFLASLKGDASTEKNSEALQNNMKSVIMKLLDNPQEAQNAGLNPQSLEQAINSITGQQLLSKSDNGQNIQTMFFNIPINIAGNAEGVKVYINGKKDREKIDWENCSIFFLIETKKAGETGIMLSASNRNLSVTFKNDSQGLEEKMKPLLSKLKENLKEVGYNMGGINFTKLNTEADKNNISLEAKPSQHKNFVKGIDTKI